jgi:transglutaminase-like putative cysteine protease
MLVKKYLISTQIIDWKQPEVSEMAVAIAAGESDKATVAKLCFEWVRDKIRHSYDYQMNPTTCSASDVLKAGAGYCYAKSHLLTALLRANDIPAGLCYQRLSRDGNGAPFALHGLTAAYIPDIGWYRIDPRGNKHGIDAQFTPPIEQIAYRPTLLGEADLPEIWPEPLNCVVQALRSFKTWDSLFVNLPDIELLQAAEAG